VHIFDAMRKRRYASFDLSEAPINPINTLDKRINAFDERVKTSINPVNALNKRIKTLIDPISALFKTGKPRLHDLDHFREVGVTFCCFPAWHSDKA